MMSCTTSCMNIYKFICVYMHTVIVLVATMPGFLLLDSLKLTMKQYNNMIFGELIHAEGAVRNGDYNMEMYQQLLPQIEAC